MARLRLIQVKSSIFSNRSRRSVFIFEYIVPLRTISGIHRSYLYHALLGRLKLLENTLDVVHERVSARRTVGRIVESIIEMLRERAILTDDVHAYLDVAARHDPQIRFVQSLLVVVRGVRDAAIRYVLEFVGTADEEASQHVDEVTSRAPRGHRKSVRAWCQRQR